MIAFQYIDRGRGYDSAIPNLRIKKGAECAWRRCRRQRLIFAPRQLLLHCPNTRHPWRLAAAKSPWMGLRRSSTGIPRTLNTKRFLKLRIAGVRLLA